MLLTDVQKLAVFGPQVDWQLQEWIKHTSFHLDHTRCLRLLLPPQVLASVRGPLTSSGWSDARIGSVSCPPLLVIFVDWVQPSSCPEVRDCGCMRQCFCPVQGLLSGRSRIVWRVYCQEVDFDYCHSDVQKIYFRLAGVYAN